MKIKNIIIFVSILLTLTSCQTIKKKSDEVAELKKMKNLVNSWENKFQN